MILQKIIIENFKGIQEAVSLVINPFNVIVGQNDVGKSTILKALDCFLNNSFYNHILKSLNMVVVRICQMYFVEEHFGKNPLYYHKIQNLLKKIVINVKHTII